MCVNPFSSITIIPPHRSKLRCAIAASFPPCAFMVYLCFVIWLVKTFLWPQWLVEFYENSKGVSEFHLITVECYFRHNSFCNRRGNAFCDHLRFFSICWTNFLDNSVQCPFICFRNGRWSPGFVFCTKSPGLLYELMMSWTVARGLPSEPVI